MKCPGCQYENREGAKFCKKCGSNLELTCPSCGHVYGPDSIFCDECGQHLRDSKQPEESAPALEEERKYVTAIFSDLSGYTAMSEKLDPEEVKEITGSVFKQIAEVIQKYDGFVEKYVGDAVMALFGVPKAHEDDPVRAIRAAREIHELVNAIRPEVEKKIGQSVSMHTGVYTGLVVTGAIDLARGTHGVAGDTINVASRLSGLAGADEILVGLDTYTQAQGYFKFEALQPISVKGRVEPVQVFKALSSQESPITIHRLSGIRAGLVGRKAELSLLEEALENLLRGKGRIFSICGDAGTGKSRLVEEFKSTLDLAEIQWLEGHAYAYAQNIPYFPLIDLLNRVFHLEEGDLPKEIRDKVESGVHDLVGMTEDVIPYVGSLYSLNYPEIDNVSPEFWKARLGEAVQTIISAIAQKAPTVFYLEDLHWADPSFVELLRQTLLEVRQPAVVLCVFRPEFTLFTSHQVNAIGENYWEIRLQDLSPSHAQDMLESLLRTENTPSDLKRYVQDKAEGNPFYLEELINALIESETLIRENGSWKITRPITESSISTTIHGLISGRLDRLEKETKRILQEASVIGRAFLYDILKKITEIKYGMDRCLSNLERLDLIRTRSLQPDLEYMFKHPLTQEVVYNGLLKKERKEIHEQIAFVMEQLFEERLPEFYETLAFHFKQGQSVTKAAHYLMRSGEKNLRRYSVEEAHHYYKEAFEILNDKSDKSKEEKTLLIEILLKWAYVYYYRGYFNELIDLLSRHVELAETLDDKPKLGMLYAWLGFALLLQLEAQKSYDYLCKALELGERIGDQTVIGYACAWLAWTCPAMGRLNEAVTYGERAQAIAKFMETDHYLYFKSLGGIGFAYYLKGEGNKSIEIGKTLVEYGLKHSNLRSIVIGHYNQAIGHEAKGDYPAAIKCNLKGISIAADPFYQEFAKVNSGVTYLLNEQFEEAEEALKEVSAASKEMGFYDSWGRFADAFLGVIDIAKGRFSQGLKALEEGVEWTAVKSKMYNCLIHYALGDVYLKMAMGEGPRSPALLAKNIGFLIKKVPFAGRNAEKHFNKTIEIANEVGAKGILGQSTLSMGLLLRKQNRTDLAKEYIAKAVEIFKECGADVHLSKAEKTLASFR